MASITRSMPLPGPRRPQVSRSGRCDPATADGCGRDRGAVGDRGHLRRVDVEPGAQPSPRAASDMTTRRSAIAATCDEDRSLVRCRIAEDGVGDHDGRNPEGSEDIEDLVAVGAAVQAVLVLHDGDVALVQQVGGGRHRRGRAVDELADDATRSSWPTRRPPAPTRTSAPCRRQAVGERGAERRQPARRGRIGAEDPERDGRGRRRGRTPEAQGLRHARESSSTVARSRRRTCTGRQRGPDGRPAQARRLSQGDEGAAYRSRPPQPTPDLSFGGVSSTPGSTGAARSASTSSSSTSPIVRSRTIESPRGRSVWMW